MDVRKLILVGSVSTLAIVSASTPALAEAAKPEATVSELVVTGFRESLERAIQIKRENIDQVDAISSDDIGKLPDKNVADALQRIPGINTTSAASGEGGFDENDRVSIRGTSPSLTQVTVDGHSIATGDWFVLDQFQTVGRSVSFTLLPSEIVQSTLVYKTQDAALLEGGVAGAIDIRTRNPLDFHKTLTFAGSAQGAYNSLTGSTKPQVSGLVAWSNADNTFGVLLQGFYEDRSVRRYGQETLGYTTIDATMPIAAGHPNLIGVQAPSLIGSALFEQRRKRAGGDAAVVWRPNDQTEIKLTGFYSHLRADNHNNNYMYWGSRELANNVPTSFTVTNNTLTSAVWPLNGPGGPVEGLVVDNIIRPNANAQSWYLNLDGKFQVADQLTQKTQVGYTAGVGNTPSQPAFEVDGFTGISYSPSGNGWAVTPTNINPQSPVGLSNDWAWNVIFNSHDREIYGKADFDYQPGGDGVFKDVVFGARIAQHDRKVDAWDRGCTLGANGQCWTAPTMPFSAVNPTSYPAGFNAGALGIPNLLIPIAGDPDAIIAKLNAINDGVHGPVSAIHTPQNYYWPGAFRVRERDYSAYLMAKVGGEGWRGNFGVRLVDTQQDSFVNVNGNQITTSAFGNYSIADVHHNYLDVLPSLNFTFDIRSNLFLRMSAAETMSRPDFSALGGSVSLTDSNLTGNGGNPNLKPIKAAVYDAALEWYYGAASVATISVFYDDLSSYVSYGVSPGSYFSEFYHANKTYQITAPINVSGWVKGVELQVQQPVGGGFGFQANATYADSQDYSGAPLVGTSKITANVVGYYENKWLSARVAYTYRSHYLVGLDRSSAENQDNYGTLDASVNVNITPNVALTFDALNLSDNLLKYYASNKTQPRAVYQNGRQFYFGVRAKF